MPSENKKEKKRRVPIVAVILAWLVAIAAVAAVALYAYVSYILKPMTDKAGAYTVEYKVPAGKTVLEVSHDLEDMKLVRRWQAFYYGVRFGKYLGITTEGIKTGFYTLTSDMSVKELADALSTGAPEYVTVTIPEGLTIKKVAPLMESAGICSAEDFIEACHDKSLIDEYGIPSDSLEGFLYPDTYNFVSDSSGKEAARRLVDTFFAKAREIPSLNEQTPKEIFKVVVLASIVEREYKAPEEAAKMAGVFTNRLKIGMKLESCATVEYVITEIQGKPHPEKLLYVDLEIDSPYNTYMYYGLPPAPISNPGFTALKAAAEPEDNDYYYFVLFDEAAGTHKFTKTLSQHNAAKSLHLKK